MPPSLSRSSMRYFPASVCPSKESSVFSSAIPSDGHNVVVSGYSAPHFGQDFIERVNASLVFLPGDEVRLSHRVRTQQSHGETRIACESFFVASVKKNASAGKTR